MGVRPRVVMVVLDAFPHDRVGPEWSPHLWSLARAGGYAREGGLAILTAATYPNHASFVTGVGPQHHGMYTNKVVMGEGVRKAHEVGPGAPTLFDRCAAAGRHSVAAFGDQNLVGVCGAARAERHWPRDGALPEGASRTRLGYSPDSAVLDALDHLPIDEADFATIQLDEVDTATHLAGPGSEEALAQCRATDAALGGVLERLARRWDETVVLVLSDHDQEPVERGAVDLDAALRERGVPATVVHEGTAALVVGDVDDAVLGAVPGLEGWARIAPRHLVAWTPPGGQFAPDYGLAAQHGSPRTRTQVAVVGGGHPAVSGLARSIRDRRPHATEWAGIAAGLLGLPPEEPA